MLNKTFSEWENVTNEKWEVTKAPLAFPWGYSRLNEGEISNINRILWVPSVCAIHHSERLIYIDRSMENWVKGLPFWNIQQLV